MEDDKKDNQGRVRQRLPRDQEEKRRLAAAALFAKGYTRSDTARMLGVSHMATSRWYRRWKKHGTRPLLNAGKTGGPPKLEDAQLALLEPLLHAGPAACGFDHDRWTLALIVELIQRECGVLYHPSHARKILNSMGWFHRPRGRPRRGGKTGVGPYGWRKHKRLRSPNRRQFTPPSER